MARTPLREIAKQLPLRVLSEDDWQQWTTWGYVVVRDAVPQEQVERMKALLWEFQEMDPADPETWSAPQRRAIGMAELNNTGMVEIYNHQYLWDNRMHQRVYDAFVDVWDTEELWVTIDRANLNPPNRGSRPFDGFIHWDADTSEVPLPVNCQGVLSLVDTNDEVGGFQCVPELFNQLAEWIPTQPADRNPHRPDMAGFSPTRVPMNAGDLLIFNNLQPHGIRPNRSDDQVRMAQYISMFPAQEDDEQKRAARIACVENRTVPPQDGFVQDEAFPGDPRNWEQTRYAAPVLTELGKRLLGASSWNKSTVG